MTHRDWYAVKQNSNSNSKNSIYDFTQSAGAAEYIDCFSAEE